MQRAVFNGIPADDTPGNDDDDELVCHCMRVGRRRLRAVIADGARTVEDLYRATGASGGCGGCRSVLEAMLAAGDGEKPGQIDVRRG